MFPDVSARDSLAVLEVHHFVRTSFIVPPNSTVRTAAAGWRGVMQMTLQDNVALIIPKRYLQKLGEVIAGVLRALTAPPQTPVKRRPF
jgi:hypothetical protein